MKIWKTLFEVQNRKPSYSKRASYHDLWVREGWKARERKAVCSQKFILESPEKVKLFVHPLPGPWRPTLQLLGACCLDADERRPLLDHGTFQIYTDP